MPKGFKDYLAEANARVETCSVQDALRLHGRDGWVFVDVRDAAELAQEGKIPQAVHASRGLLEFRIDPASPMHDPALAAERLGWRTRRSLTDICRDGWAWQSSHPSGYATPA